MSDRTDALVQAVLDKPALQDCSLQQLEYLAHQYPYYNPAQLLLLQKTQADTEAYARQLQRTALHFSNPLQLQYWLQPAYFETALQESQLFQNPIPAIPEEENATVDEYVAEESEVQTEPQLLVEPEDVQTETIVEEQNQSLVTVPESIQPTQVIEENVSLSAPEIQIQAIKPEAPAITFEPFHTVDYFASQGIKLSQQEIGNDKLGKQVKSFTEWLKTMKRLPENAPAQNTDAAGERKVENLAAHSLDKADVVTESMAEVWLKQGNRQKALEVYNKLSLRYPAKSAYFAAKIESLKQP